VPSPEHFGRFGIFTRRNAMSDDLCARVCDAMMTAIASDGAIWHPHHDGDAVVEAKRRKEMTGVPSELERVVQEVLDSHRDEVTSFFATEVARLQPLKFVRYDDGDHYRLHVDVTSASSAPELLRNRRISVVLFLNDQADDAEEGCYCGGRLTFHRLDVDAPVHGPWSGFGRPLDAERGLMVAFRPDVLHEVTPVTWGTRYTVTGWWE
jgi:SM-20-related protein